MESHVYYQASSNLLDSPDTTLSSGMDPLDSETITILVPTLKTSDFKITDFQDSPNLVILNQLLLRYADGNYQIKPDGILFEETLNTIRQLFKTNAKHFKPQNPQDELHFTTYLKSICFTLSHNHPNLLSEDGKTFNINAAYLLDKWDEFRELNAKTYQTNPHDLIQTFRTMPIISTIQSQEIKQHIKHRWIATHEHSLSIKEQLRASILVDHFTNRNIPSFTLYDGVINSVNETLYHLFHQSLLD
jgi:hypothetical protein